MDHGVLFTSMSKLTHTNYYTGACFLFFVLAPLRRFKYMPFEQLMQSFFRNFFSRIHYHICPSVVPVGFNVVDLSFKG